jgi:superfamily II DNA or RNA helicase
MTSFSDFFSTFDSDPGKRGQQFEHFVKWFLTNDPEWATQVDEVWLWQDYPGRWGRDCGVDLVFRDKTGGVWAVQAKCYSPSYEITKADVDKFLSESNRKQINHRLLIATTDGIGANARQVLGAQEKSVVRYHLADFENAAVDYPGSIERLALGKRKPPPDPRPHQIEAVENVISGFGAAARGQLVMACGTGKTFVCLWVKERLKAKKTLVLLPSLGLLSQTLNEWTFAARDKFDALCVCSDQTVNRREEDEAISLVSELPFPVSSDPKDIINFLKRSSDQVIFSTYQSSSLIAQAQRSPNVPRFDLVVADEAHRCAGKSDTVFGTVLDDRLIRSDRRLFATATPRIYRAGIKKAAEEIGVQVVDMSDENSFGKRFHTLTFGEAIKLEQLTDYRVLIVGVDDGRVKEWIESRRLVATDTGLATDARSLAGQVGLLKAIKDWNLRRLISFHSRVKGARIFSEDIVQVAEWLDDEHRPSGNLQAEHVSGEMPTILRRQKLKRLKNVGKGDIGLLSNARCLSEGVDVPALDGVAFIDPRGSEIDIIQSVGRAIRLSESKKMGTIVIPVFIEQTDSAEEALEASEFKPIWDVLEALKSHDDQLSDELDQLRIELGAKTRRSVGTGDLTKIVFDLPTSVNEEFARSLRTHLVEQTTETWLFWFGLLETYTNAHGHCRVPQRHKTEDGWRLGLWVSNQRAREGILSVEQKARLDALGFVWNPRDEAWEEGFKHLQAFVKDNGHCKLFRDYTSPHGYPTGQWVSVQRINKKTLSNERKTRLDALGFVWNVLDSQWEDGFEHLQAFIKDNGNSNVPLKYNSSDGFNLGFWVSNQRALREKEKLSDERKARLDALGFVWDALASQWEEGFEHLQAFIKDNGHCRIPGKYKSSDGYPLGQWVNGQRSRMKSISARRKSRLEGVGFLWDGFTIIWEEGFVHLQAFVRDNGHCRVPSAYNSPDGYRVGQWVNTQRTMQKKLSAERKARLDALGFIWDAREIRWEDGFERLNEFKRKSGDCMVPALYKSSDGYPLGQWVTVQRTKQETLSTERKTRLDALGFVWNVLDSQWEEGFEHLREFKTKHGHCRVSQSYNSSDGFRLGAWLHRQRQIENIMPQQKAKLELLGVVWDPVALKWEEGFVKAHVFAKENGHCNIVAAYKTADGYWLGMWVRKQRAVKDKLVPDRRQRLEALPGWVWNVEK